MTKITAEAIIGTTGRGRAGRVVAVASALALCAGISDFSGSESGGAERSGNSSTAAPASPRPLSSPGSAMLLDRGSEVRSGSGVNGGEACGTTEKATQVAVGATETVDGHDFTQFAIPAGGIALRRVPGSGCAGPVLWTRSGNIIPLG